MPSDDLRRRLELLNGGPLAEAPPVKSSLTTRQTATRTRSRRSRKTDALAPGALAPLPFAALESCLRGVESLNASGTYYHIERPVAACAPWASTLGADIQTCMYSRGLRRRMRGDAPDSVVFLDIETMGLSPAHPLFLIGLLRLDESGTASCTQLLARSAHEEAAVLNALADLFPSRAMLVTFNGRAFDLPYVLDRAAVHGVPIAPAETHLDLLLDARARYSRRLPNCKLQTLEQHLCGRKRSGDIPGHEIPSAYRDYVQTGNAAVIAVIAEHNLLDLATTAELFSRFWPAD